MRERPILFSGPMIRAILDGTKTQTRRVIRPQPGAEVNRYEPGFVNEAWQSGFVDVSCPYGAPGDRLWVRETWGRLYEPPPDDSEPTFYRADYDAEALATQVLPRWKPSIHMPRWASRITLEVTGVRVERLREITEADAEAEGVSSNLETRTLARDEFRALWESINGKRPGCAWEQNPWVWVVEFRCVKAKAEAA
jgi:hypothetical protein